MRTLWICLLTGTMTLALACGGPSVQYDFDVSAPFPSYKSYAWIEGPRPVPSPATARFENSIERSRVQRTVEAELGAKGYQLNGASPDFLVLYYPVGGRVRAPQAHMGVGFGMGPMGVVVAGPMGQPHEAFEGSIVLEIQDARTRNLVWRATAPGALQASDSPSEADADVKDAVHSMLKHFPPPR
jgi:hypothetical protein